MGTEKSTDKRTLEAVKTDALELDSRGFDELPAVL
jgi:hypothetical protein